MQWDRNHRELGKKVLRRGTRGGMKAMPPFFSEAIVTVSEIYIRHGHIPYKLAFIFPTKSLSALTHFFSTFARDAVFRSRISLCWSVGALDARCAPVRRRPPNGVLGLLCVRFEPGTFEIQPVQSQSAVLTNMHEHGVNSVARRHEFSW